MKNLELNKILGAFLFAAFVICFSSNLVEIMYNSINDISKRGYTVEIPDKEDQSKSLNEEKPSWDIPLLLQNASFANGEKIFKKCVSCHNIAQGAANKVGPNLYKIIGKKIASSNGFTYSKSFIEKNSQNFIWTEEAFFNYLYAPKKFIPGNRMAFAGIKNEKELADLLKYIIDSSGN